ncbi:hypothetical protein IPA_07220 [Ignicoccus pacificus DSM 13166]|uniref:Uncharacterized protein n=1 Tax=Ignicoccus pacificus DSM 13166 TaxID=940294 RepID=A0A977KBK0_9CREN|nr:hypothetical protein IPA_07220 [Ignicoccus pacificus DSM 13166]
MVSAEELGLIVEEAWSSLVNTEWTGTAQDFIRIVNDIAIPMIVKIYRPPSGELSEKLVKKAYGLAELIQGEWEKVIESEFNEDVMAQWFENIINYLLNLEDI